MKRKQKKKRQFNNAGVTMVELIVTFALLGIFMVAATRIIAYTVSLYYAARGASYGLEVSNMISSKIAGQLETAQSIEEPVITKGTALDSIAFVDGEGSNVEILAGTIDSTGSNSKTYLKVHYKEVTEGSIPYDAVDWVYDPKAYMGYEIKELLFEDPDKEDPSADLYPDNVIRMKLVVNSDKYGDFETVRFIKCTGVDKVTY